MDVFSKMLDRGVIEGRFGLYLECEDSLIIYFSFVDDVLIFFDGFVEFFRGIL